MNKILKWCVWGLVTLAALMGTAEAAKEWTQHESPNGYVYVRLDITAQFSAAEFKEVVDFVETFGEMVEHGNLYSCLQSYQIPVPEEFHEKSERLFRLRLIPEKPLWDKKLHQEVYPDDYHEIAIGHHRVKNVGDEVYLNFIYQKHMTNRDIKIKEDRDEFLNDFLPLIRAEMREVLVEKRAPARSPHNEFDLCRRKP